MFFPECVKMATAGATAPCLATKTGISSLTVAYVSHASEILVDLSEFYKFIKQHHKDTDKYGPLRRSNIRAKSANINMDL